jgi:molybdopterin-guanine dinucleotide biosynthesis protein A
MPQLPTSAISAYVLAGGRSTRMGRDKAMLPLAGKTLLARAVETLRTVANEVVILGDRQDLQGADRAVADLHPGRGPVGGMETALRDLAGRSGAEWACFLPVDMPFLPAGLYAALMNRWLAEAPFGVRVAYATVDGVSQPLVSLIHIAVLPYLIAAVETGRLKVTSVLEGAAKELGSNFDDGLHSGHIQLHTNCFTPLAPRARDGSAGLDLQWRPSAQQLAARHLWFSNLNTPAEFEEGERFLGSSNWD